MPLSLLRATRPDWFTIGRGVDGTVEGAATIIPDGAAKGIHLDLALTSADEGVDVAERETKILPNFCPERHINDDGTFCLGYPAPRVSTIDEANVWWGLLKDYIELQRVAGRTGRWPAKRWLSHGEAGAFHIKALEAAKRLGIEDEYYRGLEGDSVWFANCSVRLSRDKRRLVNGRSRCPMGCRYRHGYPILRRNCPHKDDIVILMRSEAMRRRVEAAFWEKMKRAGVQCCGTMRSCPLKAAAQEA